MIAIGREATPISPPARAGWGARLNNATNFVFRIEEKEQVDAHNQYLAAAEKALERIDTNIKTLEKLDAQELVGIR